ncbi:hypothetical protein [Alistipes sp. D31t1_170403_E11]|uniref:hypothetical protein n=1 Tax=Alistipes sp. D31t1_170403_E11 TaxID=2787128 RepID=UPI00189B9654|nr:hypothetical protein [Alistipes sp. D31t1_170403_E11]
MRNLYLALLLPFLLGGCSSEPSIEQFQTQESASFTIEDARSAFQNQFIKSQTRTGQKDNLSPLSPGEFTPQWSDGVHSANNSIISYDIPILSDRKLAAFRATYRDCAAIATHVNVYQKLIVVKDIKTDMISSYILTLIPDTKNANEKDILSQFLNCTNKGAFSGLAIYSLPQSNMLVRINKYEQGKKTYGVFLPGCNKEKFESVKLILKNTYLANKACVTTRAGGEDDWDFGNKDYEDLGNGFYYDEQGNIFYDYDGDGVPDSVWIPPVIVDPDPTPDPGQPEENYCPFCGSMFCSGDCQNSGTGDWGGGGGNPGETTPPNPTTDMRAIGKKGVDKMMEDLSKGNVECKTIKRTSAFTGFVNGFGVGVNTYGIFTSCTNFLKNVDDSALTKFGYGLSGLGCAIGTYQTIVAVSDGNISTADMLTITSTVLGSMAIGFAIIGVAPVAGVLGVASAVIGLASTFFTYSPMLLEIPHENGGHIYIYIPASVSIA